MTPATGRRIHAWYRCRAPASEQQDEVYKQSVLPVEVGARIAIEAFADYLVQGYVGERSASSA